MSSPRKIIVVGAGIIGASIAFNLARRGASVTVVAVTPGGDATPNSFAWINASWGNPEFYFRFRHRAMAEWAQLAEQLPALPVTRRGGLSFDLPPDRLEAYATEHGGWGYGIRRVDAAESAQIEPALANPPEFALHIAEEGAAEPSATAALLLAEAFRHGATMLRDVEVEQLVAKDGRIVGIRTANGVLAGDHVVLAAGAGTPSIAASAGIDVPLEAPAGLIVHSRPHEKLLNGLVLAPELHVRQTAEGRLIAGSDYAGLDPGAHPREAADALFGKVREALRDSAGLEMDFFTVGHRPTPRDGFPIIGPADGIPGVYVAVMHSGVTLAPVVGRLVAEEILTGATDTGLAPFRLSRFDLKS